MTIGAEVPALAGAREQILVRAGVAADARELVVEDAAREELVGDLRDDGAPQAVLALDRVRPRATVALPLNAGLAMFW